MGKGMKAGKKKKRQPGAINAPGSFPQPRTMSGKDLLEEEAKTLEIMGVLEEYSMMNNLKMMVSILLILMEKYRFSPDMIERFILYSNMFSRLYEDTTDAPDEDALLMTDVFEALDRRMGEGWSQARFGHIWQKIQRLEYRR